MRIRRLGIGAGVLAAAVVALLGTATGPAVGQPSDGDGDVGPAIVGGQPASETYPFMVSVQNSDGHFCGGSLIKPQWVVTAAHCLDYGPTQVRVGTQTWNSGGTVAQVVDYAAHPGWDANTFAHDVAVLKLDQPVSEEPITIAADGGAQGTPTRLMGWGSRTGHHGDRPEQLMELDVEVTSGCTNNFDEQTELCLGDDDPGTSACYGDSGGPSVLKVDGRWQLTGATSRAGQSQQRCQDNAAAIYSSAHASKQWIDEVTS